MGRYQPGILLAVAAGGAAGGVARAAVTQALPVHPGHFPLAVLLINVGGSLLIGALLVAVSAMSRGALQLRAIAVTGFCGGFTTWSTFVVNADQLLARGSTGIAIGYLSASVVAGLAAVVLGAFVAERLIGRRRAVL